MKTFSSITLSRTTRSQNTRSQNTGSQNTRSFRTPSVYGLGVGLSLLTSLCACQVDGLRDLEDDSSAQDLTENGDTRSGSTQKDALAHVDGGGPFTPDPCLLNPENCRPISHPIDEGIHPADLVFGVDRYLLTHQDLSEGQLITTVIALGPTGNVLTPEGIVLSQVEATEGAHSAKTAVAFNGTHFLAVWSEAGKQGVSLRASRVSLEGQVVDSLTLATDVGQAPTPDVASAGGNFLVTWTDEGSGNPDLLGTLIGDEGGAITPDGFVVSAQEGAEGQGAVAADGRGFMVVYALNDDLYGQRVGLEGNLEGEVHTVSAARGAQTAPSIAYGADSFLVSFEDHNEEAAGIGGALLSLDGSSVRVLPTLTTGRAMVQPATSFSGKTFLVAWGGLEAAGSTSESTGGSTGENTGGSTGGSTGENTSESTDESWGIDGALIDAKGNLVACGDIALNTLKETGPALASDGANYLASWLAESEEGLFLYASPL